jgi:hypothetical protein
VTDRIGRFTDAVIVVIASWTVAFHVALIGRLSRSSALVVFAAIVIVALAALFRLRDDEDRASSAPVAAPVKPATLVAGGIVALAAALAAGAANDGWFLAIVVLGTIALLVLTIRQRPTDTVAPNALGRFEGWAVIALAAGVAVFTAMLRSPDTDDALYLSRALRVAKDAGPFPIHDTLFGPERYPSVVPADSISSYEPFTGIVAWLTHIDVRTVYYLVLPTLFVFLAIVALSRLARTFEARSALFVTAVAIAFFFLNTDPQGWGALALRRPFQGKAIVATLVIPWLWHRALMFGRNRSLRSGLLLFAGTIATLGFSSSGAFIGPIVVVAAIGGTVIASTDLAELKDRLATALIAAGSLVYPAAATLWGVRSLEQTADADAFSGGIVAAFAYPIAEGNTFLVVIGCLAGGWVLVRERRSRLAVGTALVLIAIVLSGLLPVAMPRASVVSRALWILPVPVIFGLVAEAPLHLRIGRARLLAAAVAAMVLLGSILPGVEERRLGTRLLGSDGSRTAFGFGLPSWDTDLGWMRTAERLVAAAGGSGVVAGPPGVNQLVPNVDPDTYVVDIRPFDTRMLGRTVGPSFRARERILLSTALMGVPQAFGSVAEGLDRFGVEAVCAVTPTGSALPRILRSAGFVRHSRDDTCSIWVRDTA